MAAAPTTPPPLEVTAAQAKLISQCRLEICTLEVMACRLQGLQEDVRIAAAVLDLRATRPATAPPRRGSVAREYPRQCREFRILAMATLAIAQKILARRTSLRDRVDTDPFLRQFLV